MTKSFDIIYEAAKEGRMICIYTDDVAIAMDVIFQNRPAGLK